MRGWVLGAVLVGCAGSDPPTDTDPGVGAEPRHLRVASWNLERVDRPGSAAFEATVAVLARIDADVVGINEVDAGEADDLSELAEAAGYAYHVVPRTNPFGDLRSALLSRHPLWDAGGLTAAELSGDPAADDITRLPVRARVDLPGEGVDPVVVVDHLKSGFSQSDAFRRTVDAVRLGQAATGDGPVVVLGDLNDDLDDPPDTPLTWTRPPAGLPRGLSLGADVRERLAGEGLPNDVFALLAQAGVVPVPALQRDGRDATRPASDRRLDYVLVPEALTRDAAGEVYDSTDEGQGPGLPLAGDPPDRYACETASDHLPVVVDLRLP